MKLLGGLEFLRFLVVYHLVFIIAERSRQLCCSC